MHVRECMQRVLFIKIINILFNNIIFVWVQGIVEAKRGYSTRQIPQNGFFNDMMMMI